MSAQQTLTYCLNCKQVDYGIPDKNGVYTRDSGASNHWDHTVHVFEHAKQYVQPIALVLMKLHARQTITHNDLVLFRLAIALHGDDPKDWLVKAESDEPAGLF